MSGWDELVAEATGLGYTGPDLRVTSQKVPALVYVDDRAWRFEGDNFPTPDEIHAAIPWNKRDVDRAAREPDPIAALDAAEDAVRESIERADRPPDDFWLEVPCGHSPDPVGWLRRDGALICHCGHRVSGNTPVSDGVKEGAPGAIFYCSKCGCHVASPKGAV